MSRIVDGLRQLRASNIIFLFLVPLIIYSLATSRNYLPALKAVLGVEENAIQLLACFLTIVVVCLSTLIASYYLLKSTRLDHKEIIVLKSRKRAQLLFATALVFGLIFHILSILDTYAISVMANSSDPRNSDWIVVVNQSFLLTPEFELIVLDRVELLKRCVTVLSLMFLIFSILPIDYHKTKFLNNKKTDFKKTLRHPTSKIPYSCKINQLIVYFGSQKPYYHWTRYLNTIS